MARIKRGVAARKHKKNTLRHTKGFRGGRNNLIRSAREGLEKGWNYAYRDRRKKKGEYRRLWIARINAAARIHDISYSRLIDGLNKAGVDLNRKVLAEMAISDDAAFAQLVEIAKKSSVSG
ncbi:50S ribosomal protein L20 [Candidatus Poribacteria bacterium]|nr:50S ribosomal protein L20 [Candidatus Poribacteria bacterium]